MKKSLTEDIKIENFGPIKKVELNDISPLCIFIGESGSGKSTIMKGLVLFRWIYKKLCIRSYLRNSGITKSPFRFKFDQILKKDGLDDYLNDDTRIEYRRGDYTITFENGKLNSAAVIQEQDLSLDKMCYISDKRNIIPDMLAKHISADDSFYLNETWHDFVEASSVINTMEFPYLGVKLVKMKTQNGVRFFVQNLADRKKEYTIHFESASSGMQNVAPLSVIMDYFANRYDLVASFNRAVLSNLSDTDNLSKFRPVTDIGKLSYRNLFFHIEEPELSLYPSSQIELMSFIVQKCFENKQAQFDMNCMITTHSPYIVNYLNLLVRRKRIALSSVSAYEVINGTVRPLKDEKAGVIDTTSLSEPIAKIYEQFNESGAE